MKTILSKIAAAFALIIALTAAPVQAVTATGSLALSATVTSYCTVTGGSIAFGSYNSSQIDQSGTIGVTCTNGTTYTVALDAGTGTGATTSARAMTGPSSAQLNYALFRDSGRTNNWGNTTGTDTVAGTGTGAAQNLTVYGRIPGSQFPGAGSYSDTVVVTLTY